MGSLDLPDQPDEPRRAERADTDRHTPKSRELPDPDERGRYYEAMRALVSAETTERRQGPESGQPPDMPGQRGYRDDVPRFLDMWVDHQKRWPNAQRPATDRSADSERHAETADAIAHMRKAEPGLSADAQAFVQENDHYGAWLAGFEHRLKGEDRLKEKITEKLEAEPRMTAAEALREVPDAIRYTFCFQPENYTRGYYDIKERFESRGYEMYYSQELVDQSRVQGNQHPMDNPRRSSGSRCSSTLRIASTPSTYVTHDAYERIRDPATSDEERAELKAFQRTSCPPDPGPGRRAGHPRLQEGRLLDAGQDHVLRDRRRQTGPSTTPTGWCAGWSSTSDGFTDEALREDFSWKFTPVDRRVGAWRLRG